MTSYKLRNNVVVDDVRFARPVIGAFQPPNLEFRKEFVSKSRMTWKSKEVSESGVPIKPAIQFNAQTNISRLSPEMLQRCNVRFVQIAQLKMFQVDYYGAKEEDGFVTYFLKDALTEAMMDCVTDPQARQAVDFPYYAMDPDNHIKGGYFSALDDNPGTAADLVVTNPVTDKNNFFHRYASSVEFQAVLVFVHADGTREPLEGWRWTLERDLQVVWRNGEPQPGGDPKAVIAPAPEKHVVFGNLDLEALVKKNKVINVACNDAVTRYRDHPDVAYLKGKGVKPPDGFWITTV